MRLTVSDPAAIPTLVAALRAGDCAARRTGPRSIVVWPRWLVDADDAAQAPVELRFFARAWEAANYGVTISLATWSCYGV